MLKADISFQSNDNICHGKVSIATEKTITNIGNISGDDEISLTAAKLCNNGLITANHVEIKAKEVVGTGKIEGETINFTSLNEDPVHVSNTMQLSGEITGTYLVGEFPE